MSDDSELVERVAKCIDPEEGYWQHFVEAARAAIAVVLKDMDEWERKLSYTERRAWSYARENGVSLDDR